MLLRGYRAIGHVIPRKRSANQARERVSALFYLTTLVLVALFGVALFHEAIPGLCLDDGQGEEECPFCKLIHTVVLAVSALIPVQGVSRLTISPLPVPRVVPRWDMTLCTPLRGPPAA